MDELLKAIPVSIQGRKSIPLHSAINQHAELTVESSCFHCLRRKEYSFKRWRPQYDILQYRVGQKTLLSIHPKSIKKDPNLQSYGTYYH